MSEEIYKKLRERLDKLQGPFPATDSGVEIKILKKLFTPEEAEIVINLSHLPEAPATLAARMGKGEPEIAQLMDTMANKGSIFRLRPPDGRKLYYAIPFVVGIYEFHLGSLDRELAEMMEKYLVLLREHWNDVKTKQVRIIPVESSVPACIKIESYHQVRELIKKHKRFAVAPCICRKEMGLLGSKCNRPLETCLTFGPGADYYIENHIAREITMEEVFKILDQAEANALVLSPNNAQMITNICCCCSCCCGVLKTLKGLPKPAEAIDSAFQAKIDKDLCSGCGACLERCQMEAIKEGDEYMVDLSRCIGCGLCVSACPTESITMVARAEQKVPPRHYIETTMTILKEKGVIK